MATGILLSDGNQPIYKSDIVLGADTAVNTLVEVGTGLVGFTEVGGLDTETVALSLSGRWAVSTAETVAVGDLIYITAGLFTNVAEDGTFVGVNMLGTTGTIEIELGRGRPVVDEA